MFKTLRMLRLAAAVVLPMAAATADAAILGLDPLAPPSQNFDLTQWKLLQSAGPAISTVELNSGYQFSELFFTDLLTGGMVFRASNLAAAPGYAGTQLREMLAPGTADNSNVNNWTTKQGGTLVSQLRIDHVSTTGEATKIGQVIIGQIEAQTTSVARLYYGKKAGAAKGRIYAIFQNADGTWTGPSVTIVPATATSGIALGERFTYNLHLVGQELRITIAQAGGTVVNRYTQTIDSAYAGKNLHFTAGVINHNNTGDVADYAQVTMFRLTHLHP